MMNCPHCGKGIDEHPAGPCLDSWVSEVVFKKPPSYYYCPHFDKDGRMLSFCACPSCPHYSTVITDAWQIVDSLGRLVGSWGGADGFFWLGFGEYGDHNLSDDKGQECQFGDLDWDRDSDPDPLGWSAHFHLGLIGADCGAPKHWRAGDAFCARGPTAALALCRAALKATIKET